MFQSQYHFLRYESECVIAGRVNLIMGALSLNSILCQYFFSVCFYDIANDVLTLNDRTDTEEL